MGDPCPLSRVICTLNRGNKHIINSKANKEGLQCATLSCYVTHQMLKLLENKNNRNISVILCTVLGKCPGRLQRAFEFMGTKAYVMGKAWDSRCETNSNEKIKEC